MYFWKFRELREIVYTGAINFSFGTRGINFFFVTCVLNLLFCYTFHKLFICYTCYKNFLCYTCFKTFFFRKSPSSHVSYKSSVCHYCLVAAIPPVPFFRSASNRSCDALHLLGFSILCLPSQATASTLMDELFCQAKPDVQNEEWGLGYGGCGTGWGLSFLEQVLRVAITGSLLWYTRGLIVSNFVNLPMHSCRVLSSVAHISYYVWRFSFNHFMRPI